MLTADPPAPAAMKTPWRSIWGYSAGQAVLSITLNAISAYAMLYYTQARGLPYTQAGMAIALASLWDAIIDPAIGHLSDNTHSRWGRRHPYILVGGFLVAGSFYLLWEIPAFVIQGGHLFVYLVIINLLYRTAFAVFYVPYCALGFEVCTDYHQRSQLQGAGMAMNMLANLAGPALGWSLFFPDRPGTVEATSVPANFLHMGRAFAIAAVVFTLVVIAATRRYASDTRGRVTGTGNSLRSFLGDWREIISDRYLRPVLLFFCTGYVGTVFVATLQMFLYVYFVHLTSLQKSIVHGGGMVLCGVGALLGAPLARRFDKKYAACIGAAISSAADLLAVILFVGGFLRPGAVWMLCGHSVPITIIVFGACDMLNWFGVGIFWSMAYSMVSDVSEVDELHSGVRKDGGYSAIFSFSWKLVSSVAAYVAGACLTWAGFISGSDRQTPGAVRWLVLEAFGLGFLFSILVIPIALRCRTDRPFMARVKEALAKSAERGTVGAIRLGEPGAPG